MVRLCTLLHDKGSVVTDEIRRALYSTVGWEWLTLMVGHKK